jgi:hypothetical protein
MPESWQEFCEREVREISRDRSWDLSWSKQKNGDEHVE